MATAGGPSKGTFGAILRLFLPVLFLIAAYVLSYMARLFPIALFDNQALLGQAGLEPSKWLDLSYLAILLPFFVIVITNRVYGPAYALVQLIVGWIILGLAVGVAWPQIRLYLPQAGTLPNLMAVWPFLAALGLAHIVSIIFFDSMRGRPWWRAPLFSLLSAAILVPAISWGIAHHTHAPWISSLTLDLALKVASAFTLLLPYAILRPLAKPRDGFGGY